MCFSCLLRLNLFQLRVHAGLQVLGENAMLARVLLEAVGAIARSVGSRFAATGGQLRAVLLPSLERLGERCSVVTPGQEQFAT